MRILITGASGSGTTTLGRALAEHLGTDVLDLDDCYWMETDPPFTEKRGPAERSSMAASLLTADSVVSGSAMNWGPELEDGFGLIVYLWVPTDIRIERLRKRELRNLGSVDEAFIDWATQYDDPAFEGRSRRLHEAWLSQREAPVVRIEGDVAPALSLLRVLEALRELVGHQPVRGNDDG